MITASQIFKNQFNKIHNFLFNKKYKYLLEKWTKQYFQGYKKFDPISEDEIKNVFRKDYEYFELKKQEAKADLYPKADFTPFKAFEHYFGYTFIKVNKYLRNLLQQWEEYDLLYEQINVLEKELSNRYLPENIVVFRRLYNLRKNHPFTRYKKGEYFIEKGFCSTSLNLFYKPHKSEIQPNSRWIDMIMLLPVNLNAIYVSPIFGRTEYEILINRGVKLEVIENIRILKNHILLVKVS